MTVLELVNEVQRQLRLPISPDVVTDAHARLLVSYANEVQRAYMEEFGVWDELKVYGSFNTVAGTSQYEITLPDDDELDVIRYMGIEGSEIVKKDDARFRALKYSNQSRQQPQAYRHLSKEDGQLTIEVTPVPDAIYTIDFEALKKPKRLSSNADVISLDPDTVILGVKFIARYDQGEDYDMASKMFISKLSSQGVSQGESNNGDVDFL